jgi:hypothetical protein
MGLKSPAIVWRAARRVRATLAITVATLAVALAACGGDDSSALFTTSTQATTSEASGASTTAATSTKKKSLKPPRFTGQNAINYGTAYDVCSVFTVKQVANEYGTARHAASAAEGYAAGYQPGYRQAVFEGCLDAVLKQPRQLK